MGPILFSKVVFMTALDSVKYDKESWNSNKLIKHGWTLKQPKQIIDKTSILVVVTGDPYASGF